MPPSNEQDEENSAETPGSIEGPELGRSGDESSIADEEELMAKAFDPEHTPQRMLGKVLGGQYRIESHLGAGGFGDVYRAIQEKTGQLVALKVLRPRFGRGAPTLERQVARFRREMRVCAELHHAHIVRLIDSGETEAGLLFSVFEYLPGVTLSELLRDRGALTVRAAVDLMGQVLDALVCAHAKGVIHRDLKPNNIMVSTTGSRAQVTVLDFGISAFLDGVAWDDFQSLTLTREILGTPAYAAPEQLRGETPSFKSDLYAWGLVFLECLLGRRVFDGPSSMEIAYRQLSADPILLPSRLQTHPLGVLLRWVLEKDVARRAGDAMMVMERLSDKWALGELVDGQGYLLDADAVRVERAPVGAAAEPTVASVDGGLTTGERRQITAVCCHIGLGRVAPGQKPEDLDRALREVYTLCVDIADRFDGYVAGNLGGQVLVYFGFPRASDTDARRSGIVALEIAHELRRRGLEAGTPVEVKIGIHTGMVSVFGLDNRLNSPVFGVTPGLAAQLALEAPANGILVSAETFRYLARHFELEPAVSSRGEPAYRLVAETRAESAADLAGHDRAPFVGRVRELQVLEGAWQAAERQRGKAIVLRGEAGVGKSRLARELRQRLEASGSRWLEARCLPEMQHSALRPVLDLLAQELNVSSRTAEAAVGLAAVLEELGFPPQQAMPLLCPWMALPLVDPYQPLPFSPQKQKALLLDLLAGLLLAIIERRSAPLLLEDLHWADPTTLEWLQLFLGQLSRKRSLLLMTARPELALEWPEGSVEVLELKGLERGELQAIVEALTAERPLPRKVIDHVLERADGIPLFAEEIVRYLEGSDRATAEPARTTEPEVPGRLRDLLTSRLDRLGRAKETAQLASVIGREFEYALLARVHQGDEAALLADLDQMISANLLIRRRRVEGPLYMFRHALIRDAAYESLLSTSRQQVHGRVAQALESHFPEVVKNRPELLAHHFANGGDRRRALTYIQRAAAEALGRSAYREAATHAEEGLRWIEDHLDRPQRAEAELTLNGTLTPALMALAGWADPRVKATVDRSAVLLQELPSDNGHRVPTLWFLFTYHHVASNRQAALAVAREVMSIAERSRDLGLEAAAATLLGSALYTNGDLADARAPLERALALYDGALHRDHGTKFGLDSRVLAAVLLAQHRWFEGESAQAFQLVDDGITWGRKLDHVPSLAIGLLYGCLVRQLAGDKSRVEAMSGEILGLAAKFGLPAYEGYAAILHGWATGKEEAAPGILGMLAHLGCKLALSYYSSLSAYGDAARGDFESAVVCIDRCLVLCRENDEHFYEPELYRRRALYLSRLKGSTDEEARASLEQSARLARRQGMPRIELLATLELAKRREGRDASLRKRIEEILEAHPALRSMENPN